MLPPAGHPLHVPSDPRAGPGSPTLHHCPPRSPHRVWAPGCNTDSLLPAAPRPRPGCDSWVPESQLIRAGNIRAWGGLQLPPSAASSPQPGCRAALNPPPCFSEWPGGCLHIAVLFPTRCLALGVGASGPLHSPRIRTGQGVHLGVSSWGPMEISEKQDAAVSHGLRLNHAGGWVLGCCAVLCYAVPVPCPTLLGYAHSGWPGAFGPAPGTGMDCSCHFCAPGSASRVQGPMNVLIRPHTLEQGQE